jgi:hypothetical protein
MKKLFRSSLVVGGVALGLIAGMSPAYAAGEWEVAGYKPSCDFATPFFSTILYADYSKPTVSASVAKIIVVGNTPKAATLANFRFKDTCSGLNTMTVTWAKNGVLTDQKTATAPTDNAHSYTLPINGTVSLFDVGDYTFPYVIADDRWEVFGLNADNKTLSGTPTARDTSTLQYFFSTGAYEKAHSYIVRQTKLTQTNSRTTIRKGSSVTISGRLTVANGSGFSNLASKKVTLQYLSGSTWKSYLSKNTTSTGAVAFAIKPSTTKKWRLSYGGQFATQFNAPVLTGGGTVKVTA